MIQIASKRVVTGLDAEPRELTLEVSQGRIHAVHEGILPGADLVDDALVPGFVDTHCHGAAGADFTDPDPELVRRAIDLHRRHGSTTLFASTVTAGVDVVVRQVRALQPLVNQGELAGVHLEGPFLAERRKGAHEADLLRTPDPAAVDVLVTASQGAVAMVTLAPELPHAMTAIDTFTEAGVVVALGHCDADAATTRQALDQGATVATHLFNAMPAIHHREPGPVPVLLADPRVMVELICDGVHLAPEVVRMAVDAAGVERVLLVTDAMSATGCQDGDYQLGSLPVQVRRGTARLVTGDGTPGAIAGSTLTMDRAVQFMGRLGFSLVEVSAMASSNPARAHGLRDVGVLRPGVWADLCRVRDDFSLAAVMRRGRWLDGVGG